MAASKKKISGPPPPINNEPSLRVSKKCTQIPYTVIGCRTFSEILLPLQSLMTVLLPTTCDPSTLSAHNPFPDNAVYLKHIEDVVEVGTVIFLTTISILHYFGTFG